MSYPTYKSNQTFVPEECMPPNHVMECPTLFKLYYSRKPKQLDLKYRCDICGTYFAHSKWFIVTHKATEHKIPIPPDYKG